jgi:acetoin utilization protein AcuB
MLVKDIMSKSLRSVMPETSIAEAMTLMRFHQVDGLPVTINKEYAGFVQLSDMLTMFFPEKLNCAEDLDIDASRLQYKYAPIVRVEVKQVMNSSRRSVSPQVTVNEAMSIMLEEDACRLAVTESGKLVGLISFDDINKSILGLIGINVAA